jgi:LCP family protein required for cell wall assembly
MTVCLFSCLPGAYAVADTKTYANPLLNPDRAVGELALPEKRLNILLLGIDYGHEGYWGSGHKTSLQECHTDAVLVISVQPDTKKIDFISLPRDTLTYVPGIRGIYKLNAAFNCGTTVRDGLEKTCKAASWLLGGIKIDDYLAVDMNVMEKLGDAMGGVDFELEMAYNVGKIHYHKGMQHLDGRGIMDYFRARRNATVRANDIGRTGRQRALMAAICEKLKANPALLAKVIQTAMENAEGFYSDLQLDTEVLAAIPFMLSLKAEDIGSYVMTGKYRTALKGWNFTFTDQENRQALIRKVFGVEVPPLAYVSYEYTKWLTDAGLKVIHTLSVAEELAAYARTQSTLEAEQQALTDDFLAALKDTKDAFQTAADTMNGNDTKALLAAQKRLKTMGKELATAIKYPDKLPWTTGKNWYADPYVNEVQLNWR